MLLSPKSKTRGFSNVITIFLESLAQLRNPPGVAVILSGLDSDGAAAIAEFKRHGGIVVVQDPKTAEFPDMPRAAIATRSVDLVLSPHAIPAALLKLIAGLQSTSTAAPSECCVKSLRFARGITQFVGAPSHNSNV